jgi:hypothetical protein
MLKFSAGVGLVYIARWFWWRVNALSEMTAMASSIGITLLLGAVAPGLPYAFSLLIVVAGSTVIWIGVTFLGIPHPDDEILENFYRRVRPGGWWKKFADRTTLAPVSLKWPLAAWVSSSAMVLSLTLGIGKILLGSMLAGCALLAVAAATGFAAWAAHSVSRRAESKADDLLSTERKAA